MTIQAKEERTFTTIPYFIEVVEVSLIGTMRKRFLIMSAHLIMRFATAKIANFPESTLVNGLKSACLD